MDKKITAIVPAAGASRRFSGKIQKQYMLLHDKPVLAWTLTALHRIAWLDTVIIVLSKDKIPFIKNEIIQKYDFSKVTDIIAGGKERQDSVYTCLKKVENDIDYIIIQDDVRPFISEELINNIYERARKTEAAITGIPSRDTIKRVSNKMIQTTEKREQLWLIQIPQIFSYPLLMKAYKSAFKENYYSTDDASLVERIGHKVSIVEGDYYNIKITLPHDITVGERLHPFYFPKKVQVDKRINGLSALKEIA